MTGRPRKYPLPGVGDRFGKLTVLGAAVREKYRPPMIPCECDCGNQRLVAFGSLRSGGTRSCGCLHLAADGPREHFRRTRVERFLAKVVRSPGGCWLWTGALDPDGYGHFAVEARPHPAHRVSYELFVGPIPAGLVIDHVCHTLDAACVGRTCEHRACVNPAHLEPVEPIENTRRGRGVSARNRTATECVNGHPFDEANTYERPTGGRACKRCVADATARNRAKKKQQTAAV